MRARAVAGRAAAGVDTQGPDADLIQVWAGVTPPLHEATRPATLAAMREVPDTIRVLYVEDDPLLADMLGRGLRAHARIDTVIACTSAREVASTLGEQPVDVALLDLALGHGA